MLHFTKYAEEKFEILNRCGVYLTRERVEEALKAPGQTAKKGAYQTATKDGLKVVYRKENDFIKVITFYPVK